MTDKDLRIKQMRNQDLARTPALNRPTFGALPMRCRALVVYQQQICWHFYNHRVTPCVPHQLFLSLSLSLSFSLFLSFSLSFSLVLSHSPLNVWSMYYMSLYNIHTHQLRFQITNLRHASGWSASGARGTCDVSLVQTQLTHPALRRCFGHGSLVRSNAGLSPYCFRGPTSTPG